MPRQSSLPPDDAILRNRRDDGQSHFGKPETRNQKPETRNQKPETRNQKVCIQLLVMSSVFFLVSGFWFLVLHGDGGADGGMGVVVLQSEVFVAEIEERADIGVHVHVGKLTRFPRQLEPSLVEVVRVEMSIAERVN